MRQTSRDAYDHIKSSGQLKRRMTEAYVCFYNHGPMTGQELNKKMSGDGAWKLCKPLQRREVLREVGVKACSVTGRVATLWDVTNKMPTKPLPVGTKKTKKQKIEDILKELRFIYKHSPKEGQAHINKVAKMVKDI